MISDPTEMNDVVLTEKSNLNRPITLGFDESGSQQVT